MRLHPCHISIAAAIAFGCMAPSAHAQNSLFVQPLLAGGDGFLSEPEGEQTADDFTFTTDTQVEGIRWWGTYLLGEAESDNFTIRFFDQGEPGSPEQAAQTEFTDLTIERMESGLLDAFDDPIYEYQAVLPSALTVNGGVPAYVSVTNETENGWFWQKSDSAGTGWLRFAEEEQWQTSTSGNVAFELLGLLPPVRAGDYDNDLDVDQDDYQVWKQNYGSMTDLAADGNGDGVVDAADYTVWRDHLGEEGVATGASLVVPEPVSSTLVSVMLGLFYSGSTRSIHRKRLTACRRRALRLQPPSRWPKNASSPDSLDAS